MGLQREWGKALFIYNNRGSLMRITNLHKVGSTKARVTVDNSRLVVGPVIQWHYTMADHCAGTTRVVDCLRTGTDVHQSGSG